MDTSDIMNDPFFTPILFQIERRILGCARVAQANGIHLNDSQIRSTLNKVRKSSEGAKPQIPNESPRDQALVGLHHDLLQVRSALRVENADGQQEPLPKREWLLCLRTVEESIQRHSSGPGSRAYLAWLSSDN